MDIFEKNSFDSFKEGYIYVSTNRGEGTRISFASAADAGQFLKYLDMTNELNLRALPLSDVYSVLGLPTPSIFAGGDWGWLTPVDRTLECYKSETVVHLAAPIDVSASAPIVSPQFLARSMPSNASRAVFYDNRNWKHLEKFEPKTELPYPAKVIRSGPMTIAVWPDKSKTYVRIKDDDMSQDDPEKALALVTLKKLLGPHKFRKLFKEFLDKK